MTFDSAKYPAVTRVLAGSAEELMNNVGGMATKNFRAELRELSAQAVKESE